MHICKNNKITVQSVTLTSMLNFVYKTQMVLKNEAHFAVYIQVAPRIAPL